MELRKGFYILLLFWASFSFTLRAQPPEPPTITSLDVDEQGKVTIYWNESPTPGVTGYILYRDPFNETDPGFIPLTYDIPASAYSYVDNTAQANVEVYSYNMAAYIGDYTNDGTRSDSHSTMYLEPVVYDTCANRVRLNWSPYIGWGGDKAVYEIFKNDGELGYDDTDTSFYDNKVIPGETYTYYIKADHRDNSFFSNSNRVTLTIPELKKPDNLFITAVENTGSEFVFTAAVDPEADLSGHQLGYSTTAQGVYEALLFIPKNTENSISYTQAATNPLGFYKVSAINICNKPVDSTEVVRPLVLDYTQQDLDVVLQWNTSFIEGTETYDLFLSIDKSDFFLQESALSATSLNYTLDGSSFGDANSELFCFYVLAHSAQGKQSSSNTICLTRQPKVYLPTAFTPNGDGKNDYIQPEISHVTVEQYLFVVYDRYGGKVFETKNSADKWRGLANNKNVSEGAYLYYLEFKTSQGVVHKQSGAINVVYP